MKLVLENDRIQAHLYEVLLFREKVFVCFIAVELIKFVINLTQMIGGRL